MFTLLHTIITVWWYIEVYVAYKCYKTELHVHCVRKKRGQLFFAITLKVVYKFPENLQGWHQHKCEDQGQGQYSNLQYQGTRSQDQDREQESKILSQQETVSPDCSQHHWLSLTDARLIHPWQIRSLYDINHLVMTVESCVMRLASRQVSWTILVSI